MPVVTLRGNHEPLPALSQSSLLLSSWRWHILLECTVESLSKPSTCGSHSWPLPSPLFFFPSPPLVHPNSLFKFISTRRPSPQQISSWHPQHYPIHKQRLFLIIISGRILLSSMRFPKMRACGCICWDCGIQERLGRLESLSWMVV